MHHYDGLTLAGVQVGDLHKANGLDLRQPQGAHVEDLCGLGNECPNRKGLVEGHSMQTCMAPFGVRATFAAVTTPRGTFGPRAAVLPQVNKLGGTSSNRASSFEFGLHKFSRLTALCRPSACFFLPDTNEKTPLRWMEGVSGVCNGLSSITLDDYSLLSSMLMRSVTSLMDILSSPFTSALARLMPSSLSLSR